MLPTETRRVVLQENRSNRTVSCVAAVIACWLWGSVAAVAGVAMLVLLGLNRCQPDTVGQSLLFRLILQVFGVMNSAGLTDIPGLKFDFRLLGVYNNRDYTDMFLIGSSLIAFFVAAAIWATAFGLTRSSRWAIRSVVGVSAVASLTLAAYARWCFVRRVGPEIMGMIAIAAAIPAIIGFMTYLQTDRANRPVPARAGRTSPLLGPLLLIILSIHATLIVPALTFAWLLLGILVKQLWLSWQDW